MRQISQLPGLLYLHQISDGVVWAAYMIIAVMLWKLYRSWRQGRLHAIPIERNAKLLVIEFSTLLVCGGFSHLHAVLAFWYPACRGNCSFLTSAIMAGTSAITVLTLSVVMGMALRPKAVQ